METAKTIVDALTERETRVYLADVLLILFCEDGRGTINPNKECGADDLGDLCSLLDPLVN